MKNRITSTFAALALVVAALVTAGTMTATATETGEQCTHQYSGWVTESPGKGWNLIKTRTVIDKEAYDETVVDKPAYDETVIDKEAYDETVPGKWWNWSPNNTTGPQDYTPGFPGDDRGTWQGPHTEGGPDGSGTFNVSHGASGNSSWFHRDAPTAIHHPAETHVVHHPAQTHVVHHPAVTHEEYKYKKTVCPPPGGPTPVQFSGFSAPTPPTCDQPGSFSQQAFDGITFEVSPEFDGPGTYTVTATLVDPVNTTFPGGTTEPKTATVTVDGATGVTQSTNPDGPCYQAVPPGEENPPPGENPPGGNTPGGNTPGGNVPTGSSTGAGPTAPSGSTPTGSTPSGGVPTSIDAGL